MEGLSKAEFERQLVERFGWKQPAKPVIQDPLEALDGPTVRELLPDLLRAFSGRPARNEHPLINDVFRAELGLNDLRTRSGMTSSDFSSAMADSLSILALSRFESANADIQKVALDTIVSNFKSHELASLSMGAPPETFENDSLSSLPFQITEAPRAGRLRTFGGKVRFSKSVWSSYGETIASAIANFAGSIYPAIEMKLLSELLEASTLQQTTQGSGYVGLDTAISAMRKQVNTAGLICNYGISAILCPPDLEASLRAARELLGAQSMAIVTNSYLSSPTTYYAFAEPARSAAVLRLKLRNAGAPRVYSSRNTISIDEGIQFLIEHDIDFQLARPAPAGVLKCVTG